ncbi:hypothetical protein [Brevibacillus laterosporus]|uniref:hypothetical protein n=1 Tax=Brevibacillus laterosporus TaxID=1465 RepID=UPI003D199BAD
MKGGISINTTESTTKLFTEIEKYLQTLAKTRAIHIGIERKLLEQLKQARQAMK